jgi:hypothetical protein
MKAMKIGTIARAGAALFLIGLAVSHLEGQGGVKKPMTNSVSYRNVKVDGLSSLLIPGQTKLRRL